MSTDVDGDDSIKISSTFQSDISFFSGSSVPLEYIAGFASNPPVMDVDIDAKKYPLKVDHLRALYMRLSKKLLIADGDDKSKLARSMGYLLQSAAGLLLPKEKVRTCCKYFIPKREVEIWHTSGRPVGRRAKYRNLQRCGSYWMCPVCASAIAQRRSKEILEAAARSNVGLVMLTLTYRHNKSNASVPGKLVDEKRRLDAALRALRSGSSYNKIKAQFGILGTIRAYEVTYGDNGWHPHIHLLFVVPRVSSCISSSTLLQAGTENGNGLAVGDKVTVLPSPSLSPVEAALTDSDVHSFSDAQAKALESWAQKRWGQCLTANGLSGLRSIRARVTYHADKTKLLADYISKFGRMPSGDSLGWTAADELTKSNLKRSRDGDGVTPFGLLAEYLSGNDAAGALSCEYAASFKGEHSLRWSAGLKATLLLDDTSDENVAESVDQEMLDTLLINVGWDVWRSVLDREARADLLAVADTGDIDALQLYLFALRVVAPLD